MIAEALAASSSLSVRRLCALLDVNRAWYYARSVAAERGGCDRVRRLRDVIERIVLAFPGYGYRRVTQALAREGWAVNHKRVLRVMREESLLCQLKRRFVPTTDSGHGWRTYPNLMKGTALTAPNQAWVADITYIRLPTTFVYLAAILDAYSRRCVGWELSRWIDTDLTLAALTMALARRRAGAGIDPPLGSWGAIRERRLRGSDWKRSGRGSAWRRGGNPYENAKAESFFKTLETRGGVSEGVSNIRRRAREPGARSSKTCTTRSGCIRASAIGRPSSSRRRGQYRERLTCPLVWYKGFTPSP